MKNNQQIHKIIVLLFLICVHSGYAQLLKQKDRYTVYINYPDYSVKTTVSNSKERIRVNESMTYYWYSANKIMQTKGDYDGKIVDGPYTSFYLSNGLKEKGEFKKGIKDGKWMSWYENGKINEITNWKNGKKSGEYKKFNADESLLVVCHYKRDKQNGEQIFYTNGKVDSVKKFKNGLEIPKKIRKQKDSLHQDQTLFKKLNDVFKSKKNKQDKKAEAPEPSKNETKKEEAITLKKKKKSKTPSDKSISSAEKTEKEQ